MCIRDSSPRRARCHSAVRRVGTPARTRDDAEGDALVEMRIGVAERGRRARMRSRARGDARRRRRRRRRSERSQRRHHARPREARRGGMPPRAALVREGYPTCRPGVPKSWSARTSADLRRGLERASRRIVSPGFGTVSFRFARRAPGDARARGARAIASCFPAVREPTARPNIQTRACGRPRGSTTPRTRRPAPRRPKEKKPRSAANLVRCAPLGLSLIHI